MMEIDKLTNSLPHLILSFFRSPGVALFELLKGILSGMDFTGYTEKEVSFPNDVVSRL